MKPATALSLLVSMVGLTVVACQPNQVKARVNATANTTPQLNASSGTGSVEPLGDTFEKFEDLKPDALPPKLANLILSGTKVEVELNPIVKDGALIMTWLAHGVEVEREKYAVSPQSFSLVAGPAESYEPAVPLLKFPFQIGQGYDYTGAQTLGRISRPATAKVSTSNDSLNLETGNFQAVLVTVLMHVETGTPGGTESEFKFWFKPGEGLIRREFGFSSTREPRKNGDNASPSIGE